MALDNKTAVVKLFLLFFCSCLGTNIINCAQSTKAPATQLDTLQLPTSIDYAQRLALHETHRTIRKISTQGTILISPDSIRHCLPLKCGDEFNVNSTASMIKNIYNLGYFKQIKIYAAPVGDKQVDLLIQVEEKPKLNDISFIGNKTISEKALRTELKIEKIATLIPSELKALIVKIKKYYCKKNYHNVQVESKLITQEDGRVLVEFNIHEGKKSYLTRISFKGNKHISSKRLKRVLFSKEDWLLSVVDHAGTYSQDMTEGDKYMIEELYKNHGFINAKVTDIHIEQNPKTRDFHITYTIHEDDRYQIKTVNVQGNDIIGEQQMRAMIPIFEGQYYSVETIKTALENLRLLFGEYGYIFADIEPSLDIDEPTKTVTITFNADPKEKVYLNRLTIRGNQKARDKVIRRQILINEGEMITNIGMDLSKASVNRLGYTDDKNGVNWKITRLDNTHADLDLLFNEKKTGYFQSNLSYGGSPSNKQSPQTGLCFVCNTGDKDFVGTGINLGTTAEISQRYRAFNATASNPWLFDRPIHGLINGFIKAAEYDDQLKMAQNPPIEHRVGGIIGLGYLFKDFGGISVDGAINLERISYDKEMKANDGFSTADRAIANIVLQKYFQTGNQISLTTSFSQDMRNGVGFITHGHQWKWFTQLTIPGWHSEQKDRDALHHIANFNYFKTEFDVTWYTPLINEHDLVLCVHGNIGYTKPFAGKDIPWGALYHMGGPQTIRGYLYGQVGPNWKTDSIGATKGFCVNVEFIVPLSSNLNTCGVIFYDGGAGWDTPYHKEFARAAQNAGLSFDKEFSNNNFVYRHSVGIGIRIKSPSPVQVDFGIKLNPSKLFKNEMTQMHLNMVHEF